MSQSRFMNRIYNEIENCNEFSRSCITFDLSEGVIKITCIYDNKFPVYFKLNNEYPFKPPEILKINNRNYNCHFWNISRKVYDKIYYHYKIQCFFCNSKMCFNNWHPVNHIVSIIKEIMAYEFLIKAVYNINMLSYNNINFLPEIEKHILSFIF